MTASAATTTSGASWKKSSAVRALQLRRELWRRSCRQSLTAWCTEALSAREQSPARHHRLLISELELVAAGVTDRLMIFMPPGSAKSSYASVLFPPWLMAQSDNLDLIGASHGADLAEDFSGRVLRVCEEHPEILGFVPANQSVKLWRTNKGHNYRAAGVGGAITGRRADVIIIDDPIKGRAEADSLTIRDTAWNWYRAEVITRLKPGGRIILIQTRWHEDDLAGRLLQEMAAGGDQWRIINLPAIAESEDDPLGRELGEALWPEWEDAAALQRKRASVGEREWAALYQQRPRPLEGALFKIGQIEVLPAAPAGYHVSRGWDLAATKNIGTRDPDWTAGVKLLRTTEGRYVVLDVVRERGGPDEVKRLVVNTAAQDGRAVQIAMPQDPGQAGKAQILDMTRALAGHIVDSQPVTGDKATRAAPVASQVNVGNLSVVLAPWNRAFLDELAAFPSGKHDDQVDALDEAFRLIGLGPPPLVINDQILEQVMRAGGSRRRF